MALITGLGIAFMVIDVHAAHTVVAGAHPSSATVYGGTFSRLGDDVSGMETPQLGVEFGRIHAYDCDLNISQTTFYHREPFSTTTCMQSALDRKLSEHARMFRLRLRDTVFGPYSRLSVLRKYYATRTSFKSSRICKSDLISTCLLLTVNDGVHVHLTL
ncbi:hypothetical protein BKA93DRAFT_355784 [Sparassis latifolia]